MMSLRCCSSHTKGWLRVCKAGAAVRDSANVYGIDVIDINMLYRALVSTGVG